MGALDKQLELTELGRILARLPIEPLLGKTIVMGVAFGCVCRFFDDCMHHNSVKLYRIGTLMCDIASSSSFSSPFVPRERSHTRLNSAQRSYAGDRWSDHIALVGAEKIVFAVIRICNYEFMLSMF